MHGRALLLTLLALLLLAAPASAREVDVPALLQDEIAAVRAASDVPVRLPQRLPTRARELHPSGGPAEDGWVMGIATAPDCGGASACFLASFTAERGARPANPVRMRLRGGRRGWFRPLSCGASCAPPSIEWRQGGVLYRIQAFVGTARTERRRLVRMANSAILHGRR